MSDSWDAPRPTKRSRRRGEADQQEEQSEETGEADERVRREREQQPAHYGPPGAPYPYYSGPAYSQQWQPPYPPPGYGHYPEERQPQTYWAQEPHHAAEATSSSAGASVAASPMDPLTSPEFGAVPGVSPAGRSGRGRARKTIDVMSKKEKKNAQSRARAAKLRDKIEDLKERSEDEKTEEELKIFESFEERRRKKNLRSRERALEKKAEMERIMAIPENQRSKQDQRTLDTVMKAKLKKNEGDRLRRERLKQMGLPSKSPGPRGRGRPKKAPSSQSSTASAEEGRLPTSELQVEPASPPALQSQDLALPSPSTFMSPGLMSSLGFPSPLSRRTTGPSSSTGQLEVSPHPSSQIQLPTIPPESSFQQDPSPASAWAHPSYPPRSHVQQRQYPDGRITISIFGGSSEGTAAAAPRYPEAGEQGAPQRGQTGRESYSNVSQMLLYGDNNNNEDDDDEGDSDGGDDEDDDDEEDHGAQS